MTHASLPGLPSPTGKGRPPHADNATTVAFEAFVKHAAPRLTQMAKAYTTPYTAEDLVAETFEVMYVKWQEVLSAKATPLSYAYGVLRNKIAGTWRTKSREVPQESAEALDVLAADVEESAEQTAVRNLQAATLHASIMSALTERERHILVLHYGHSFTTTEVAELLGITTGTVRSTLSISRRKLEHSMKRSSTTTDT